MLINTECFNKRPAREKLVAGGEEADAVRMHGATEDPNRTLSLALRDAHDVEELHTLEGQRGFREGGLAMLHQ